MDALLPMPTPPAGTYGAGSAWFSFPLLGYVVSDGSTLAAGVMLVPIEDAVKAPLVDGVPEKGVCGSEVKFRVGAAETEVSLASEEAEVRDREPNTLSISRVFNII